MELIEEMSSKLTCHLCVGPAPRNVDDMNDIVFKMRCTAVLNVADEEFLIVGRNLLEEEFIRIYYNKGIAYRHIPLTDGYKIPLLTMEKIIRYANCQLKNEGPYACIYIHCHAGLSRSPAAAAIILMGYGLNPEEVKRFLERNHPRTLIHPTIWASIVENAKHIAGTTRIQYQQKD